MSDPTRSSNHCGLTSTNQWPLRSTYQRGLRSGDQSGVEISFSGIEADDKTGRAHWEAIYNFSETGRRVHNKIDARFEFRDDKIIRHADTFDLLADLGAEVVPFSALDDMSLPADVDAVYLGGGFPELYAREIAANIGMRRALEQHVHRGAPLYAECGGLMALGQALVTLEGERLAGFGLLPLVSRMTRDQLTIGYREVEALRPTALLDRGERMRGHEFHWSTADPPLASMAAYRLLPDGALEGYCVGSIVASYVHLSFAASPAPLARFVRAAAQVRESQTIRAS